MKDGIYVVYMLSISLYSVQIDMITSVGEVRVVTMPTSYPMRLHVVTHQEVMFIESTGFPEVASHSMVGLFPGTRGEFNTYTHTRILCL